MIIYKKEVEMKEILIRVAANGALIAGLGGLATAMVVFIANFDDSISESLPKFFAKLTMV